jgi:hypothetical protein
LAEAVSADLFDSPVRRRLRRRLLDGHSVVWLVVQSDNAAKTQRVTSRLEQQLARLPQQIQLPEGIGLPGSELYADVPLVLKFSVLTIDPADPRERFLVQLLTGLRQQAFDAGEPLLVPVFGRGRALEVIPGEDLQGPLAGDLTRFLCGACSCQVKEQNPGFDLLMTVDWDHELFGDSEQRPPKQAGSRAANAPVLVPIPPGR